MLNNITIIIPIYNEKKNITPLLISILNIYKWANILVVDDFSTDDSISSVIKLIKKDYANIKVIEKDKKIDSKWLTFSIIKWINLVKTKYFIVMDWDFQHPVKNIQNFINLFNKWKNIVIWERSKIVFKEKEYRILISKIWNLFINIRLYKQWFKLNEPLSWFFWWESIIFQNIIKNNKNIFLWWGYKFLFEFLKLIKFSTYNLWTFNFNFWKRKFWNSKISIIVYLNFIKWLFR